MERSFLPSKRACGPGKNSIDLHLVNKACASEMKAIVLGYQEIVLGNANVVLGVE
jgi:acetyl-CoA acetyltransferase